MIKRNFNLVIVLDDDTNRPVKHLRGACGLTVSGDFTSDIIINLHGVWMISRKNHRSFEVELVGVIEHEYAHAIGTEDEDAWAVRIDEWIESEAERISYSFEEAGAWARR